MPEDPLAHSEIAALTRRFEDTQAQSTREFGIVKSELTTLQLKVSNLDQKFDSLFSHVGALEGSVSELRVDMTSLREEVRAGNARIVELLSRLVGEPPE